MPRTKTAKNTTRRKTATKNHNKTLGDAKAAAIKRAIAKGTLYTDIAAKYGVSASAIAAIADERSYKYVPWPDGYTPTARSRTRERTTTRSTRRRIVSVPSTTRTDRVVTTRDEGRTQAMTFTVGDFTVTIEQTTPRKGGRHA